MNDNEEQAMVDAVIANPSDDLTKLIYCDFLEEKTNMKVVCYRCQGTGRDLDTSTITSGHRTYTFTHPPIECMICEGLGELTTNHRMCAEWIRLNIEHKATDIARSATKGYTPTAIRLAGGCCLRTAPVRLNLSQKGSPIMPKPFKLTCPRPLPPDAELVNHEGRPHARLKWRGRLSLFPLTKNGQNYLRPSKCWYFKCRDGNGTVRRVKGFSDLKATEQLAAEMERNASRSRAGIIDPAEEHTRYPLADHLKVYAAALEAKGNTNDHTTLTVGRVNAMLVGCGFVFPLDCDAGKASEWLNTLRRDDSLIEIPARVSFAPSEVAKLLGISAASVRATVKRLNLPATGNAKNPYFSEIYRRSPDFEQVQGVCTRDH